MKTELAGITTQSIGKIKKDWSSINFKTDLNLVAYISYKCNVCYTLFSSLIKLFWLQNTPCSPKRTQFNSLLIFPGILTLVWRGFWAPGPGRASLFVIDSDSVQQSTPTTPNKWIVFMIVQPIKCLAFLQFSVAFQHFLIFSRKWLPL